MNSIWQKARRSLSLLALLGLGASACTSGGGHSLASTSTLPPLPPTFVGLVSLIGNGTSAGSGQTLEAIDLSAGLGGQTRTIAVGQYPDALAVATKRHMAYVANYASNTITPIDLDTGRVGKPIDAGSGPAGIAISPDEKTAYVTDAGSSPIGNTVTPINLLKGKALAPITVGKGPQGIVITPDGKRAYVADAGAIVTGQSGPVGSTVTPIDLQTRQVLSPIAVGNGPLALAVTPDGSSVLVADAYSGSVTAISVLNDSTSTPIEVNGAPQAIAISPDGLTAWVAVAPSSVASGNDLTPIDLASATAGHPIAVPKNPTGVAITPDGATAWVVCYGAGSVVPVSLSTKSVVAAGAIALSGGPYAIAISEDKKVLHPAAVPAKKAKS